MAKSHYISGRADQSNIDKWSDRASANSFHNSDENKKGGAPNEQTRSNNWFTARERKNYVPIGRYPGSDEDRGA
jgi:hypothetical protein